jgi:hypothetical protein
MPVTRFLRGFLLLFVPRATVVISKLLTAHRRTCCNPSCPYEFLHFRLLYAPLADGALASPGEGFLLVPLYLRSMTIMKASGVRLPSIAR